ncbi:NERD domain-containing protein [Burkholderia multivorans]|uniref:NERD domain-containing protein n=1 Tax=Burkholderia multivorans TaxID=87883 RepID=A0AAP2HH28_9BURK|nr:nuclease-related domain-containing protein [Burkholderia multivorans]MBU9356112.1 NERD domain-containing protein [Burkholderia multivorans]MBU9366504.1 NERD domain-containing protein [Burkholderia multivorans]MBU9598391.1 NERD domain-containing protein [Burkholderia multivorans]MCA8488080.1 NERD domain-containing protein [Burkholderia multivorans]
MTIDVYCGDPEAPRNGAEQRVLARIVNIMQRRCEPAIVLINVRCNERECDLLVSTPVTTLVIEVKHYLQPVAGGLTDAHWTARRTGERWKNPCLQVRHTMHALKDALRRYAGQDPGYPRCAVLFDGGIPPGSDVPRSTDRIAITDDSELEDLLASPLIERGETRRWPLALLRTWAVERCMVPVGESLPDSPAPPVVIELAPSIQPAPAPLVFQAQPEHRPRGRRRFKLTTAALLAMSVISSWYWSNLHPVATKESALRSIKHGPQQRHYRHSVAAVKAPAAPTTSASTIAWPVTTIEPPPASLEPLPPCPAGVDRLGCVPDSATLRLLRRG